MKKTLLFLLLGLVTYGQQFVTVMSGQNGTSGVSRAPQGSQRFIRTVYVVSAAEIAASGMQPNTVVNNIGFEYLTAQNVATQGTLKIYLQNTTDATYGKTSDVWNDIINGMTLAHDATSTIPAAVGMWNITFSGGAPFTYTGGGMYIAFEWANPSGTLATVGNVAACNTDIVGGLKNATNASALPASVGATASNFRPLTRLGFSASCISPSTFVTSNLLATSATVSFTAPFSAPANGYEYILSATNTPPTPSSTPTGTISTTSLNLTNLLPGTSYFLWVRSVCGTNERSIWINSPAINTSVLAPYSASFESNELTGWTLFNAGTGNNWGIGNGAGLAATGTNYAVYSWNSTNAANAWLFSRTIALSAGVQYTITFKVRARADGPTMYPESMKATIGATNTVAAQTTILWDSGLNGINYETYTTQTGTFTPATTGSYVLGFHCYSVADMFQLLLDDVFVNVPLNLDENNLNNVSIYPVPVYDGFYIKSTNLDITGVNVYDLNGRLVKSFQNALENYNISELNSGIYMVEIKNGEETQMKKIIKK